MIIAADNINPMNPVVADALERNDAAAVERILAILASPKESRP